MSTSKFFQRLTKLWSLKKFTSAYLFQIARVKSGDYLLMKKLGDSFKISLIGVNPRKLGAKINHSNAANIITRAVKTTFCSMFLKFASCRNGLNSSWNCSMCLN